MELNSRVSYLFQGPCEGFYFSLKSSVSDQGAVNFLDPEVEFTVVKSTGSRPWIFPSFSSRGPRPWISFCYS
jgi:hypothetical protein